MKFCLNKKLSYHKQLVLQLRTQYVDSFYSNSVTFKSLGVTEGRWKWHHTIDHTRLTIVDLFDVEYYCDLEV